MDSPTVPVAFVAGLVSFLSPCVLPLVPGYLSYMSGVGAGENDEQRALHTATMAGAFVMGFSAIFVALGATASVLGSFLAENKFLLARVGGVFIILMGLVFMGVLKIPFLYREARFHPTPTAGLWGSTILGAAFAFGWSPCIGATMAAVLTMAAGESALGGPGKGAGLMAVYSLGLGIPFVLAGLGISKLTRALGGVRRHVPAVELGRGVLPIWVGVRFLTERLLVCCIWM